MESMAAEEDFEPNQDSSFSEDEHLPRGGAVERPLTPGEYRKAVGAPAGSGGPRREPGEMAGWGPGVEWGPGVHGEPREASWTLVW